MCMARSPDSFIPTRRSLLIRLKNMEDQESWRDFDNTYRGLIYSVAIRAGLSHTEAQDAVQETFRAVAKKMPEFQYDPAIGSFKGWLLTTTQWRISDQFRKRRKEGPGDGERSTRTGRTARIERIADPAGLKLEEIWDAEWEKNLIEVALEKVKAQVRAIHYQIFDLYVMRQLPVKEVAQTLGVSAGLVYLAKHRVQALLKKELKGLKRNTA